MRNAGGIPELYSTKNDDTLPQIAAALGIEVAILKALNREKYPELCTYRGYLARLKEGTQLVVTIGRWNFTREYSRPYSNFSDAIRIQRR